MRKIPFAGVELTSQRVTTRYLSATGATGSLQPVIPPKRFDIFPLTGGCSEVLDAFRFFFKIHPSNIDFHALLMNNFKHRVMRIEPTTTIQRCAQED